MHGRSWVQLGFCHFHSHRLAITASTDSTSGPMVTSSEEAASFVCSSCAHFEDRKGRRQSPTFSQTLPVTLPSYVHCTAPFTLKSSSLGPSRSQISVCLFLPAFAMEGCACWPRGPVFAGPGAALWQRACLAHRRVWLPAQSPPPKKNSQTKEHLTLFSYSVLSTWNVLVHCLLCF